MKTKIIYISGSEIFDMADIRAAFEQVRTTMALPNDTVLFGVPVDTDDALAPFNNNVKIEISKNDDISNISTQTVDTENSVQMTDNTSDTKPITADETNIIPEPVINTPVKKTRRRATKNVTETVIESNIPTSDTVIPTIDMPITPILSVLAPHTDNTQDTITTNDTTVENEQNNDDINIKDNVTDTDSDAISVATNKDIDVDLSEQEIDDSDNSKVDEVITDTTQPDTGMVDTIDDKLTSNAPIVDLDKDITALFGALPPLSEDQPEIQPSNPWGEAPFDIDTPDTQSNDQQPVVQPQSEPLDETLLKLATEYNEFPDITDTQSTGRGKIGKLKNILPFKKAKREDSGLFGDLFGWAEVANDDDFAMPGFFTGASKK